MVDLGCGAGFDVFQAGGKVGMGGRVVGVDMNAVGLPLTISIFLCCFFFLLFVVGWGAEEREEEGSGKGDGCRGKGKEGMLTQMLATGNANPRPRPGRLHARHQRHLRRIPHHGHRLRLRRGGLHHQQLRREPRA